MATKLQDIGGLSQAQASGIQTIYKQKLASGLTPAQAQEAIKADPSFSQAKAQYQSPVQPVTPTISAQVATLGQQKTEGAPKIPKQPQPQAETNLNVSPQPVSSTQAITTPPVVEKTTTITPEGQTVVKKETPGVVTPDYNVGKGREQEILTNLNEGYSKDPAIQKSISTGDYNTFKQAYGYDTADQTKKTMLDAFFQARQPKNSESFFQTLTQGMKIENSKYRESSEARNAQHRFDVISPYKGTSIDTLYNGMINKIITPGSDAYKDLVTANGGIETPEMLLAKQKLETNKKIENINDNLKINSSVINGETYSEKPDATQVISDKIVNKMGFNAASRFKEMVIDNEEIKADAKAVTDASKRIKELERVKQETFTELKKQYPGLPMGALITLSNQRNNEINKELNGLKDDLSIAQSNLQYRTAQAEKMFNYEYEAQKDTREFGQQKELAKYQQTLGLEGKQAEFEQQMKQKAQMATDPVLATQDLIDTYAKIGVLPSDSPQQLQEWVQREIKKGRSLGDVLGEMNKNFQSKDQYKAIVAEKTTGKPVWQEWEDATGKHAGWITPGVNPVTGGTGTFTGMDTDFRNSEYVKQYPNEASFKNNNPAGITWNANFDNGTGIAKALQDAGITYSKGTARPASEGGNYVQFNSIGDGMKARQIVFSNTYGNKDLSQALQSWKEGSRRNAGTQQYADSIMKEAGINTNQSITYNNLSQEQKDALTLAQIKRESGGLYKVLTQTPTKQGPSTADQIFDTIFQNSGGASKVSGDEAKIMNKRAREYAAQGLSAQDALLKYKGLNLSKEVSPDIAQQYINIGDNLLEKKPNDFEGKVAKYLNAGDVSGLNTYVNGLADDKVKARYGSDSILSSTYKTGNDRTDKLVTLIENNKDKLGAFDGNVSNLLLKFKGMPEYQQLKTILTMSQADTRKYFAGSAVTATELSALEDFIGGKTTMNPDNLVTMLKTIKEDRDNTFASQRIGLTVPTEITPETATKPLNIKTPTYKDFYN